MDVPMRGNQIRTTFKFGPRVEELESRD